MKKTYISRVFFVLSLLMVPAAALGTQNFYRAGGACKSETRPNKNWLTSANLDLNFGWTSKGENGSKNKVDALNIYGNHDLHSLLEGVPNLVLADNLKLIDLRDANAGGNSTYGKLLFKGKFVHLCADLTLTQNFKKGFFAEAVIPFRYLQVKNISWTDQTDRTAGGELTKLDIVTADLVNVLNVHNVSIADTKKASLGDVQINVGWTHNNNTKNCDFIDTTIKAGVSVPSGKKKDENKAFSLAAGYDGHTALPVSFDMAVGMYEWLNWGAHVGGTFFLKDTKEIRMQTNTRQNGFIKLGLGKAKRDRGNLFDVGTYVKADHIAGGLSVLVGYNFVSQKSSSLKAENTTDFPTATINDDEMLKAWNAHTLNGTVEYDFSKDGKKCHPVVGLSYSRPVAGKRVFTTNTVAGSVGAHFTWNF